MGGQWRLLHTTSMVFVIYAACPMTSYQPPVGQGQDWAQRL